MKTIHDLLDIMARLRDPKTGCPWDKQQTYASIVPYTIEEAYEVAEAIEQADYGALRGELGDLLFQVVFYAQIAREEGRFDFAQIVDGICEKMLRRHPHVFGDQAIDSAEEQTASWEAIKAEERQHQQHHGALDGVNTALPALSRARKLQQRAARVGFDWPQVQPVFEKLQEEVEELHEAVAHNDQAHIEEELGDLMFVCVNLARHLKLDPESALRRANRKFEQRFRHMEALAEQQGEDFEQLSLDQQEALWLQAKKIQTL